MDNRRGWRISRDEDFQESDMWDIMTKSEDVTTKGEQLYIGLLSRRLQSAARLIPKAKNPTPEPESRLVQHSAPVDIPDWSKIYGKSPKESSSSRNSSFADCDYEEYEDDQTYGLPPHKWLARKHMRSQTSSFSVCEGAGRTLKGRDLTRVRDAVFTKTGFMG